MGDVVNIKSLLDKKKLKEDLSNGRQPLYASHLGNEDFGDRLLRIRTSLERINQLMSELKKTSGTNVIQDENKSRR